MLIAATPAPGSAVRAGRVEIRLRYNSRIDAARSRVVLFDPAEGEHALTIAADGPNGLSAETEISAAGRWRLRWQVLALDGHITRGDVPFRVTR